MKILVIDTETTGVDIKEDHICEIGMEIADFHDGDFDVIDSVEFLIKPPVEIPFEATGVNHITNEMVANEPPIGDFEEKIKTYLGRADYLCAHNMPFDYGMLSRIFPHLFEPMSHNLIDTLRFIRKVSPDIPSYSLNVLRYRYKLDDGLEGEAHRALFDVGMCRNLLKFCLEREPVDFRDLPEFISAPMMLKNMTFGKHKGMEVSEMVVKDRNYVRWLFKQDWFEVEHPDLVYTIKSFMR